MWMWGCDYAIYNEGKGGGKIVYFHIYSVLNLTHIFQFTNKYICIYYNNVKD